MTKVNVRTGQKASDILMWIRFAEADYIAARMILLAGFLVQGTALANTALEKFLKAICTHMDVAWPKRLHDISKLYDLLIEANPHNTLKLNKGFLELTSKAYTLRYPDIIPDGFNLSLSQAQILAQLDRSVLEINMRFQLGIEGNEILLDFQQGIQNGDPKYVEQNVAIDPSKVKDFFASMTRCYDIRKHGNIAELHYEALNVPDDLKFDREGLAVDPNDPTVRRPAFAPIDPNYAKFNRGIFEK